MSALPSPLRWWSNQAATRASTRSASRMPPSCPPAAQSTDTGAPFAAMAAAIASAWSSGKRESSWPCTMRAGTLIRSATADGLRCSSRVRASASGFPATATRSYIAHSSGVNLPQPGPAGAPSWGPDPVAAPVAVPVPAPASGRPPPASCGRPPPPASCGAVPACCIPSADPVVKKMPDHSFLKTPPGKRESARFQ